MKPQRIVRAAAERERQIGAILKNLPQSAKPQRAWFIALIGDEHGEQAGPIGNEVGPIKTTLRLAPTPLAERQQPAEPGVSGPIHRIDEEGQAVPKIKTA